MKQLPLLFLFANANDAFNVTYKKTAQNEMELKFTLGEYKLKQTTINNEGFTQIVFNHSITTAKKGFAALPYLHASLELNNNKNISLVIEEGDYIDYQLENHLIPSKGTIYRNQDPDKIPYKIAPSSIKDSWYPERLAENTEPYILKDKRGVNVYVYPFVYNAKKKVLRVYKTLKIKLIQNQTLSINPIPNSNTRFLPEMEPVYKSVFINHNTPSRDELTLNQYGDMLVITTERDEEAIAPYIEWKQEKGFAVEKEVVATGTNVKELIKQEYEANNNILYVVLVGDWDDIKSDQGPQDGPMDTQLGCVVGTDNVADIIIGRISANSPADVTTQINKCIGYEKKCSSKFFLVQCRTWHRFR
jgi:gingipain R